KPTFAAALHPPVSPRRFLLSAGRPSLGTIATNDVFPTATSHAVHARKLGAKRPPRLVAGRLGYRLSLSRTMLQQYRFPLRWLFDIRQPLYSIPPWRHAIERVSHGLRRGRCPMAFCRRPTCSNSRRR